MLKQKEKLIFVLFLFSCIFLSISFVSAENNAGNNELQYTLQDDSIELNYDINPTKEDNLSSFNDFQNIIDNAIDEINITEDYIFHEGDTPIIINKSLVINGNNHCIDAKFKSRIFNIYADNVIIKNITFMNSYRDQNSNIFNFDDFLLTPVGYEGYDAVGYTNGKCYDITYGGVFSPDINGGAIYCNGDNLKIIYSSFINNFASRGGGIYIDGANSQLINVAFINNTAKEGGGIFNAGKNTFISKCKFDLNYANYIGFDICSHNDINIQNCNFTNDSQNVVFSGGNWQIDNMNSTYFDSFIKFGHIDFKFNLTHIRNDYYNLKITFGYHPFWMPDGYICDDKYAFSVNRKFCLNIDGNIYNLQTDENSQSNLYLNLSKGVHNIEVYNSITNLSISKAFNVSDSSDVENNITLEKIKKVSPKIIAKNKTFNKGTKIKKYTVTLKNNSKAMKNAWITLKINGKTFKAKTNNKGQATFKITKLTKKAKYNAMITYKGNMYYNKVIKKIKIIVK